jgi:ankyrin repeat protein
VHRALKGMCVNGTRVLTFPNGIDVSPDPLPISKFAAENVEDKVTITVTLRHITSQADYQIFNSFKMGNLSDVMHMIEDHKGVNAVDEWGTTILMHAVRKGNLPVVASLLNTRMPKVDVNLAKSVSVVRLSLCLCSD